MFQTFKDTTGKCGNRQKEGFSLTQFEGPSLGLRWIFASGTFKIPIQLAITSIGMDPMLALLHNRLNKKVEC